MKKYPIVISFLEVNIKVKKLQTHLESAKTPSTEKIIETPKIMTFQFLKHQRSFLYQCVAYPSKDNIMSNYDNNYYNSYYPAPVKSQPVSDRRIFTGMAARSKSGSSSHGSYSGYGSSGHDCCPLVVDPLTLLALGAFLAAAVYLLNELIAMSMLMMARKRKRSANLAKDLPMSMLEGRL